MATVIKRSRYTDKREQNTSSNGVTTSRPTAQLNVKRTVITESGTFQFSSGTKYAEITAIGGGGGGNAAVAGLITESGAGGGGAAGYMATGFVLPTAFPIDIVIGAGGAVGSDGLPTSVGGELIVAPGGKAGGAGASYTTTTGGVGGLGGVNTAPTNDGSLPYYVFSGENGQNGIALPNFPKGGSGGKSYLSMTNQTVVPDDNSALGGGNGSYGVGGAGGARRNIADLANGGVGGNGVVEIVEYM